MYKIPTQDIEFASIAIDKGYITHPQWMEYKTGLETGAKRASNLAQLLVLEGRMTSDQAKEVYEEMQMRHLPEKIGDYRIDSLLGKGGMGSVYKASKDGEIYALKVIAPEFVDNEMYLHRFVREFKAMAELQHPNILRALDYGIEVDKNLCFVALEFVHGKNLMEILQEEGSLPVKRSLELILTVSKALDYASESGIIHRDIKPDNIMLDQEGNVKIADFGVAKKLGDTNITKTGTMVGTPYYVAPEVAQGLKGITIAADVYSLGISLFHLLAGVPPFRASNPMQVIMQHLMDPLPQIGEFRPDIEEPYLGKIQKLLETMTAKNAAARPSPSEVIPLVQDLLEELGDRDFTSEKLVEKVEPLPSISDALITKIDEAPSAPKIQSPEEAGEERMEKEPTHTSDHTIDLDPDATLISDTPQSFQHLPHSQPDDATMIDPSRRPGAQPPSAADDATMVDPSRPTPPPGAGDATVIDRPNLASRMASSEPEDDGTIISPRHHGVHLRSGGTSQPNSPPPKNSPSPKGTTRPPTHSPEKMKPIAKRVIEQAKKISGKFKKAGGHSNFWTYFAMILVFILVMAVTMAVVIYLAGKAQL